MKFLSSAAIVAAVIALMAGPAAADATLAVSTDPQPTPPGGSTSIAIALTPTLDTNVSFDPTLTVSSSSADVTLSITSNSAALDPCTVASNVVTCTPPGLLVSDGVQNLVVNLAVGASATPSSVTITASYTQFSTPAVNVTRLFDIIPPPPTTPPTTEPTTTVSVAASTVSTPSTGTGAGQLPNTGSSTPALVWIGVVLAMSGTGIVLTRPRRRGRAGSDS